MSEITLEERGQLAQAIVHILDGWGLPESAQVSVLGLPEGTPSRTIRKYRKNTTPLPDDAHVMERVEHLVGIAEALRTTFPRNAHMGPRWMRQPHRRFNERTPLATIVEDGLSGLIAVRAQLDCAFAWECSESQTH